MKHTPGPWITDFTMIEDRDDIVCVPIYGPGGEGFGRVGQAYAECGREDELKYNAQLQHAAPDMLEALESALEYLEANPPDPLDIVFAKGIIRVAIAKATGGK